MEILSFRSLKITTVSLQEKRNVRSGHFISHQIEFKYNIPNISEIHHSDGFLPKAYTLSRKFEH